jgi:transcriptional regulator with XRE-family HTH domain
VKTDNGEVKDKETNPGKPASHSEAEQASYLRRLREEDGLTQQEAAERAGLSVAFLSFIENGRQKPSAKSLLKLAKAYRSAEVGELLGKFGYSEKASAALWGRRAGLVASPLTWPNRRSESNEAIPVEDWRLDWALFCIAHDREYSMAQGWEELPFFAKALTVRLYQSETGRMLLTAHETASLNEVVHGRSHLHPAVPVSAPAENTAVLDAATHRAWDRARGPKDAKTDNSPATTTDSTSETAAVSSGAACAGDDGESSRGGGRHDESGDAEGSGQ